MLPDRWRRLLHDPRFASVRTLLVTAFAWLDRRVRGFYSAVGLFLVIGLGLAVLALLAFAGLAESVMEGETHRFDEAALRWMDRYGTETLDRVALEIAALGDGTVVVVLVLVCGLLLWLTRNPNLALMLWVATAGGLLFNTVLKLAFERPRPRLFEWRTDHASLSSFPSGHATSAMVVYVALAYVISRLEPTRWMRRATFALFGVLILLIGLSRVYLGVHYPSDVIAGYAVGFAWAAFSVLAVEVIQPTRRQSGAGPGAADLHVRAGDPEPRRRAG